MDSGFRIGDLRVDPRTGDLTGAAGREQLDPKVMGVLLMLAERPGEVVSREALLGGVWPGTVVSDDALTRCLYELRRQMASAGGDASLRAVVETLPKRGYRLKGDVVPIDVPAAAPAEAPGRRAAIGLAAALIVAAAFALLLARTAPSEPPRVAVLPFLDLSEAQDQRWLADGIAEEITDRLTQTQDLQVTARTSSFSFRDQEIAVPEIARRLGVSHVLEGSIRRSDDRIRVTAQLISAADATHLWSQTYERELHDLFAIQDEIAVAVAAELEATVRGVEQRHSTENVDALVQFAQGEHFYRRREPGDSERAVEAYRRAVELDPAYARAWAALAGAYQLLANETYPPDAAIRARQGDAARRAVALDPKLSVAHYRLGQFEATSGRKRSASAHFAESFRLDPGSPLTLSARSAEAFDRGDGEAAVDYLRQAVAADPMALSYRGNLAVTLQAIGRYAEALAEYRGLREAYTGPNPDLDFDIARALLLLGRVAEAAGVIDSLPAGRLREHGTAMLVALPGGREAADAALVRLMARPLTGSSREMTRDALQIAESFALRGRNDEAIRILLERRRALESAGRLPNEGMLYLWLECRLSPFLRALATDPRWQALKADGV